MEATPAPAPPVVRVLVSLLVCVAIGTALWRAGATTLHLGKLAGESSRLDYADREIGGGNGVIIDQAALYEAQALIPARASYRMLVGSALQSPTPLSEPFAPIYFRYFLMPRRQAGDARWIVCFGCDLGKDAPGATKLWEDGRGISIARTSS